MTSFRDIYRQPPIRDENYILPFGRHQGLRLGEVLENDPDWLVWIHNNTDLELHADILDKAERLHRPVDWFDVYQLMDKDENV